MTGVIWINSAIKGLSKQLVRSWEVNVFHAGELVALNSQLSDSNRAIYADLVEFWERHRPNPMSIRQTYLDARQVGSEIKIEAYCSINEIYGTWPHFLFEDARRLQLIYCGIIGLRGGLWAIELEPGSTAEAVQGRSAVALSDRLDRRVGDVFQVEKVLYLPPLAGEFMIAEAPSGMPRDLVAALWTVPLDKTDVQALRSILRALLHSGQRDGRTGETGDARDDDAG